MKINEMTNLWVGYNEDENFTVLICSLDREEAYEIVNNYCLDSRMQGKFEITEFKEINTHFDCDYILTNGQ